jgi:hypothetical protein
VTVIGLGFAGATRVAFNGVAANFSINSNTQLTTTVPAGATSGPITVANGQGAGSSPSAFVVVAPPPTVSSVAPSALGQGALKRLVEIVGANFVSGATVSVSGSGVTVVSVQFVSSTELSAKLTVSGNAPVGLRNVTVTNPDFSAGTCNSCLRVNPAPVVSSVSPSSANRGPTNLHIRIFGSNFVSGAKVKIKSASIVSRSFVNSGEIDAVISIAEFARRGPRTVTITNPDFGVGKLPNGFTIT